MSEQFPSGHGSSAEDPNHAPFGLPPEGPEHVPFGLPPEAPEYTPFGLSDLESPSSPTPPSEGTISHTLDGQVSDVSDARDAVEAALSAGADSEGHEPGAGWLPTHPVTARHDGSVLPASALPAATSPTESSLPTVASNPEDTVRVRLKGSNQGKQPEGQAETPKPEPEDGSALAAPEATDLSDEPTVRLGRIVAPASFDVESPEPPFSRRSARIEELVSSVVRHGNHTSESVPTEADIAKERFRAHQEELKEYYAELTNLFCDYMSPHTLDPTSRRDSKEANERIAGLVNTTLAKGETVDVYPDGTMVRIPVEVLFSEAQAKKAAKAAGLPVPELPNNGAERKKLAATPFFSTVQALRDAKTIEGHVHGDLSHLPEIVVWSNGLHELTYVTKPRIIETTDGMTVMAVATRKVSNRDDVGLITHTPLAVDQHPYKHKEEYMVEYFTVPGERTTLDGVHASHLEIVAGQTIRWDDEKMSLPLGIRDDVLMDVSDAVALALGEELWSIPERGEDVPETVPQPAGWAPYHTRAATRKRQRQMELVARMAEEERLRRLESDAGEEADIPDEDR